MCTKLRYGLLVAVFIASFHSLSSADQPVDGDDFLRWQERKGRSAVALLRVHSQQPSLIGLGEERQTDLHAARRFANTQQAMVKSFFVINVALNNLELASIPFLKDHRDPMEWLRQAIQVKHSEESEIMEIRVFDEKLLEGSLEAVCNAVVDAYITEAAHNDRRLAQFTLELLKRSYNSVQDRLERARDEHWALAQELGTAESTTATVEKDIFMKRLDLIEREIMKMENRLLEEQLLFLLQGGDIDLLHTESDGEHGANDSGALAAAKHRMRVHAKILGDRVAELKRRRRDVTGEIKKRSEVSSELMRGKSEIQQLGELAARMGTKIKQIEIDLLAPDRVVVFQPATFESGK